MKTEYEFDAGYHRVGSIYADVCQCDGCGKIQPCVVVDNSESEYASGAICLECATKLIDEVTE